MPMVSVRVGEIPQKASNDVVRGEIRIDPSLMDKLGLESGDPVEIEGPKRTVAKAASGYPADEGLELVRIDGYMRRNAGVTLGDVVEISPVDIEEANAVTLAPADKEVMLQISDTDTFKDVLSGLYVVSGDKVLLRNHRKDNSLLDSLVNSNSKLDSEIKDTELLIVETFPKNPVRITQDTEIQYKETVPDSHIEDDEDQHPIPESQVLYLNDEPDVGNRKELEDMNQLEKITDSNRLVGCYETEEERVWIFYEEYYYREQKSES